MNRLTATAATLAAAISIPAFAQQGPPPDPFGDAAVTKADFVKAGMGRFDMHDGNKDGTLSADEIAAAGNMGRGMARAADDNRDGAVTKDEYAASQNMRFDMMDANKDGSLTKAERDEFRAQMMQRFGGDRGGISLPPP